ncbi:MAG: hypothetical protein O3B01_03295 [Planctomycetota bacterium]|nr:hypothetical protein [Planctomycetota bacterium]
MVSEIKSPFYLKKDSGRGIRHNLFEPSTRPPVPPHVVGELEHYVVLSYCLRP